VQRYVAFVAGLPCGRDSVGMDTLRKLFTRLGFLNVETFLTNGNVIFDTAPVGIIGPLEAQIERFLMKSLEAEGINVFIRTPQELLGILASVPFRPEDVRNDENHLFVVLLSEEPDERTAKQLKIRRTEVDELRLSGKEIYWLRRPSPEQVPPPLLSEILDAPATVRSFHTIARIVAKCTPRIADDGAPLGIIQSVQSHQ
jgi:uncharacterized protein (DUF1697 family)